MNCEVNVVLPTSEAPNISTVNLGAHTELFFEDSLSSSSVLDRKLDRPEWEIVRLKIEKLLLSTLFPLARVKAKETKKRHQKLQLECVLIEKFIEFIEKLLWINSINEFDIFLLQF
jgi:hypothetical protein